MGARRDETRRCRHGCLRHVERELRNGPNFGFSDFSRRGWWLGAGRVFSLETLKLVEGTTVVALGGVDAALEAGEVVAVVAEGLSEGDFEDRILPHLALDSAEAAEEPFAIDEGIDEHALFGCGGTEALVVIVGELFELRDRFAGDSLGSGVDAGFKGVHGGVGLALDGAGSGGFFCVETIG